MYTFGNNDTLKCMDVYPKSVHMETKYSALTCVDMKRKTFEWNLQRIGK